jgi:membrane fusion protein, multidrug efflux system
MDDHTASELAPQIKARGSAHIDPDLLSTRQRSRRAAHAKWVLFLIVLLVVGAATFYWYVTKDQATTDDAYTDGHAIAIAPQIAGTVVSLDVTDNQRVTAGQLLMQIDPRAYVAARDQAQGNLQVAQAQLANARIALESARIDYPAKLASAQAKLQSAKATQFKAAADEKRQRSLPKPATMQQDVDNAEAALLSANAQVDQAQAEVQQAELVPQLIGEAEAQVHQLESQVALARAQLEQAELNLSWTKVTAPQDGWITKRNVEQGNYVQSGQSVLSIVTPDIWITANFKESQLERMRVGQKVDISVDAYPQVHLKGHVDSVQLGSGSRFTAFPPENATGNFVKIVQRVPVKIVIDSGMDANLPLPLGISVVPTVSLSVPGSGES